MNIEKPNHIENLDYQGEGSINLDSLSFEFCNDDFVGDFYDKKLHLLENKDIWLEENRSRLEEAKGKIAKAVEDGLIKDSQPETIWQFQVDKAKEGQEKILEIKNKLEGRIDEIKTEITKKLSKFLPDWSSNQAKIIFTMNEKADFCIDNNTITVDLGRLLFEQDPTKKVKEGTAHEVFHLWMSEKSEWSDSKQDEVSDQDLKERIVFQTIDEGLAVLVSEQSLEGHHLNQGRSYLEYKNESFESFQHFLSENERQKLEEIKDKVFQDMGHFYVVGNEIAVVILQHDGLEKFRKQIVEARNNPSLFLQRYREICKENADLLKIDS